jgi:hypothetical protein
VRLRDGVQVGQEEQAFALRGDPCIFTQLRIAPR